MRSLVTGGEHTAALAAVRALRAAGHEPWAGAASPRAYAARSRAAAGVIALPDSGSDPAAFRDRVGAALEELGARVVIPGTEEDLVAIASSTDFNLRAAAGLPEADVVRRVTDKTAVYQHAAGVGISVPDTKVIDRDGLLELSAAELPLIVKPIRSARAQADGRLIRVDSQLVISRDQLRSLAGDYGVGQWLLQPPLAGQLGAVCGIALGGQVVTAVHQVSRRVWPPGAGVSAFAETVAADAALETDVARLIKSLSWSGIFQAQFMHNAHGSHFIDLNPRVYGSLALATAAGVNLPAIWAELVTGSPVFPAPYRVGIRYRSEELDVRALLHLALHGQPRAACGGMIPRRHTAHSIMTISDPTPALTSLGKLGRYVRRSLPARERRSRPRRSLHPRTEQLPDAVRD